MATIHYYRPNGKTSRQEYDLTPMEDDVLQKAAEYSQNLFKPNPLVELRIWNSNEVLHWEFRHWNSFWSSLTGLQHERALDTIEEWAERIQDYTGMSTGFVAEALAFYRDRERGR